MLKLKGRVHRIDEAKKVSDSFTVRSVIIETLDKYPAFLEIRFKNDRIKLLSGVKKDQLIEVEAYLSGRMFNEKNYLELTGISLNGQEGEGQIENDGLPF